MGCDGDGARWRNLPTAAAKEGERGGDEKDRGGFGDGLDGCVEETVGV